MMRAGLRTAAGLGWLIAGTLVAVAADQTPESLLKFTPRQRDVEIETPAPADIPKCKVDVEKRGQEFSYVLLGPQGQVLRKFVDTNDADTAVDQFRFYQHGIEVYREIRSDNGKFIEQFRWLNLGGSRWGIDQNGDGRIDVWKSLSAAEASREAVRAMVAGDAAALQALMITADDLKTLGINKQIGAKLLEQTTGTPARMKDVLGKSKVLTAKTKWIKFDGQMPGVVPADEGKATGDIQVYENAMVMVEPGPGMVQIGEMIRVGEVWKLTQVPQPIEGDQAVITSGGLLMQPLIVAAGGDGGVAPSPEMQKLIEDLQKLDQNQPQFGSATKEQMASYHSRRIDLLVKLQSAAEGEDDKVQFFKQCVEGLTAAVETDSYPEGLERLEKMESDLRRSNSKSPVLPYIVFRRMRAKNSQEMKAPEAEQKADAQKAWLKQLEEFVADYPEAEDAADAMLQIANTHEFGGQRKEATEWYGRLVKEKASTPAGAKGAGALRRLELKGKSFVLQGASLGGGPISTAQLRGKVVLVFYWATWCQPCKADLPLLRTLYDQYRSKGFEVVGVCLDIPAGEPKEQVQALQGYLSANKVPWPQIYEPGGLDSPPAVNYGVISLPTMFLIDQQGKCVSNSSSVAELKAMLPQLLPGAGPNSAQQGAKNQK